MRGLLLLLVTSLALSCATAPPVGQSSMRLTEITHGQGPHGAEFAVMAIPPQAEAHLDLESATMTGQALRGALSKALRDLGRSTLAPEWVDRNVATGAGASGAGAAGLLVVSAQLGKMESDLEDPEPWMRLEVVVQMESGGRLLYTAQTRFASRLRAEEAASMDADARASRLHADWAGHLASELLEALR